MSTRAAWFWWGATRLVMLVVAVLGPRGVMSDVGYYLKEVETILSDPTFAAVLPEYPLPVVLLLALPWLVGARTLTLYAGAFVGSMLLVDAGLHYLLRRTNVEGAKFWLAFVPLLGPVMFFRFDLAVTALIALSLLPVGRTATGAAAAGRGAALAAATALKAWPIVLLAPVVAALPRGRRLAGVAWTLGWGALMAVGSVALAGLARLFSPLSHQANRGLELESTWAVAPMLERAFGAGEHVLASAYGAVQVEGPWIAALQNLANAASIVTLAVVLVVSVRALRMPTPSRQAILLAVLVVVATLIVTNRVFSPQYVVWLAAPVVWMRGRPAGKWRAAVLVMAAATQLTFPVAFFQLFDADGPWLQPATLVLAIRNVMMVGLWVWLLVAAWRASSEPALAEAEARTDGGG